MSPSATSPPPVDPPSPSSTPTPATSTTTTPGRLPFPSLTHTHILNCALPTWYPRYHSHIPKTRLIPLSASFLSYLREDGIFLPPQDSSASAWSSDDDEEHGYPSLHRDDGGYDSGIYTASEDESGDGDDDDDGGVTDPTLRFAALHETIKSTINDLGGAVFPKLNWSAPKDAAWISPTNTLECRSPSDIYLLLKSSDFITHDLEHPFDDCVLPNTADSGNGGNGEGGVSGFPEIQYHLALRKWFTINPSVEFRCFVKDGKVVAICQRDLNYYEFLHGMKEEFVDLVMGFYGKVLKGDFPDPEFVFDVYIPRTQSKVWLMDINPWAYRTDPLLFSWMEILMLEADNIDKPELRLVNKDDPEAYLFNTPQYSAHKLPKEVVDAGMGGAQSIQEFAEKWREIVNNMPDS